MLPDLTEKLRGYVEEFNSADEEIYINDIDNAGAFDFLRGNAPLLDCPDAELEKTYYFRLWTLRKHVKTTPHGRILTEFLPPVCWAGPYNSINCPLGHHLREARWLRDGDLAWEYVNFWLDGIGDGLSYSTWFASSVEEVYSLHPRPETLGETVEKLAALYEKREEISGRPCGLFWSHDDRDGMELSISGPGIRPTLNSYMCGDAYAISRMAERAGLDSVARTFRAKADRIRERIDALLWDGDFYRTIPCRAEDEAAWAERPEVPEEHRARELVGYLPWYFGIAGSGRDGVFAELFDTDGFSAPYGLTTAERRHPRFMFENGHECLWNGYVWPYATSQTLTALANMIRDRGDGAAVSKEDYYALLRQYALSHRLKKDDGEEVCFIDENMPPFTGRWYCRDELIRKKHAENGGLRERGKDYNHSTFCDLVLSGLLGISRDGGATAADPMIPDGWSWFAVTGLPGGASVIYDRDGTHYGVGAGLRIMGE